MTLHGSFAPLKSPPVKTCSLARRFLDPILPHPPPNWTETTQCGHCDHGDSKFTRMVFTYQILHQLLLGISLLTVLFDESRLNTRFYFRGRTGLTRKYRALEFNQFRICHCQRNRHFLPSLLNLEGSIRCRDEEG